MDSVRHEVDLKGLGDLVRRRRRELGLTQTQLGQRTGWVQERISLLESGKYGTPSLPALAMMADALETSLAEVLTSAGFQELADEAASIPAGEAEQSTSEMLERVRYLNRESDRLVDGLSTLHSHLEHTQRTIADAMLVRAQVQARRKELEDILANVRRQASAG
jgi:transcriptional regulator with XRE-family HTH domain